MPTVTDAQRHKVNRDPISDPHIVLIEFQEDGQSAIERVAINNEDVTWRGETYTRAAIDVTMPSTGDGEVTAQLEAANVDRILSRAIDGATQRINVRLILIDIAAPDTPIIDTKNLMVIPSAQGGDVIVAQLGARASGQEPIPFKRTTKAHFPGIWFA
jgi:CheY-like chemotaxis protein